MRAPASFILLTALVGLASVFALGWLAGAPLLIAMGEASERPDEALLPYILATGSPILAVAILASLWPLARHREHMTRAPHAWTYALFGLTTMSFAVCWAIVAFQS